MYAAYSDSCCFYTHTNIKYYIIFYMVLNFTQILCYTISILHPAFSPHFSPSTLCLYTVFVGVLTGGYLVHFKLFSIKNSALEHNQLRQGESSVSVWDHLKQTELCTQWIFMKWLNGWLNTAVSSSVLFACAHLESLGGASRGGGAGLRVRISLPYAVLSSPLWWLSVYSLLHELLVYPIVKTQFYQM